jgi:predicted nucleic acid-binding protein
VIAVDTNVLIYAHREEMPYHSQALAWLRHLAEGQEPWVIPVFCLGEFIRVVTHPRVFDPPTPLETALDALDQLLASPTCRVLNPGPHYPRLLRQNVIGGRRARQSCF